MLLFGIGLVDWFMVLWGWMCGLLFESLDGCFMFGEGVGGENGGLLKFFDLLFFVLLIFLFLEFFLLEYIVYDVRVEL